MRELEERRLRRRGRQRGDPSVVGERCGGACQSLIAHERARPVGRPRGLEPVGLEALDDVDEARVVDVARVEIARPGHPPHRQDRAALHVEEMRFERRIGRRRRRQIAVVVDLRAEEKRRDGMARGGECEEIRLSERVIPVREVEFLLAADRHVRERGDDLLIEQRLALRVRPSFDRAVAVVVHRREVEVQRVGIERADGGADSGNPQRSERGRGRIDEAVTQRVAGLVPELADRLQRVWRLRLICLHTRVIGIGRRDTDDVGVEHHLEAEPMSGGDEGGDARRRRVIGIVDVVPVLTPVGDIEQRLRRIRLPPTASRAPGRS